MANSDHQKEVDMPKTVKSTHAEDHKGTAKYSICLTAEQRAGVETLHQRTGFSRTQLNQVVYGLGLDAALKANPEKLAARLVKKVAT